MAAIVVAGSLWASAAMAAESTHAQCLSENPDVAIRGCTAQLALKSRKAIADRPHTYGLRANAYVKKGDYTRALADHDESIRLAPNNHVGYLSRGLTYERTGDLARAIDDYERAVALKPDDDMSNSALTRVRRAMIARVDARAAAPAPAATPAPVTAPTPFQASDECQEGAAPEVAIEACTTALARADTTSRDRAMAHALRGLALRSRGDHARAAADFDESIDIFTDMLRVEPSSQSLYLFRAEMYAVKGDDERAEWDYDEHARRHPQDASLVAMRRGHLYEFRGDLRRAEAEFEKVSRTDPSSESAKSALARVRATLAAAPPAAAPPPVAQSPAPPAAAEPAPRPVVAAAPPEASPPPATTPSAPPARRETRVALVIGNADYRNVARLPNPPRDAGAVAEGLRRVGFATVQVSSNLSRDGMIAALRAFEREAEKADWAVVYFAGHGIEVNGMNYLIPVDAALKADKDVQDEAVPLERVLSAIESARKLRLVILDACRDNPFMTTMKRSIASRSIGRGLAQVEPEGGVLVAYAAKHGQVALDGDGANSPFVSALVKRLDTPGLDISLLFRLVRDDVLAATARQQEPYVYGSLPGEVLSFRPQ